MQIARLRRFARPLITAALAGMAVFGLGSLTGLALQQYPVSQKGRNFTPTAVSIARGEAVLIVNDDADLRHHAYIDSDKFRFDSGDQEPGSRTTITFPVEGSFDVLCAIHPKMKLTVNVK
jgi:plastocyanin